MADKEGGAIFFTTSPFSATNTTFMDNKAQYGQISGSYPLRMKLSDSTLKTLNNLYFLNNTPTGIVLPMILEIEICDLLNQKINTINSGYISVTLTGNTEANFQNIEGATVQQIKNGSVIFDHLILFSDPVNITLYLKFTCNAIDQNMLNFNLSLLQMQYYETISSGLNYMMILPAYMRSCLPGEIYDKNISVCSSCPVLSYSLNPTDTKCTECPIVSDCFGGMNFSLHPGFWRSSIYSDNYHQCEPFQDSCM